MSGLKRYERWLLLLHEEDGCFNYIAGVIALTVGFLVFKWNPLDYSGTGIGAGVVGVLGGCAVYGIYRLVATQILREATAEIRTQYCVACEKEISQRAKICPHCGEPYDR